MADAKLSELTAATTAAASDTLYLVQSSTSKKITVANFFASVATPVVFTDKIQIQDSYFFHLQKFTAILISIQYQPKSLIGGMYLHVGQELVMTSLSD